MNLLNLKHLGSHGDFFFFFFLRSGVAKCKQKSFLFIYFFYFLGGAVRNGVLCARGKLILFVDADGATRFCDYGKVEEELIRLTTADGSLPGDIKAFDWTFPAVAVGSR